MALNDLERASALIQQRRFDEARALLTPLNDPTAQAWLKRIDMLEGKVYTDPFAGAAPEDEYVAADRIRTANMQAAAERDLSRLVPAMRAMEWEVGYHTGQTVEFIRGQRVAGWVIGLLVFFFGLIGALIACGTMATRPKHHITVEALPNGKLRARSESAYFAADGGPDQILAIAASIPKPVSYGLVIGLGIASSVISYILLYSSM